MKKFLTVACICALPAQAQTSTERYHAEAMAALKQCEETWFQSRREEALKVIDDAASRLVVTLNPLSRNYDINMQMLADVTSALKRCGKIVYQDLYPN